MVGPSGAKSVRLLGRKWPTFPTSGVGGHVHFTTRIEQAAVHVDVERIEEYASHDARTVVALPANEYFDDECVSDVNSALGAYVDRHFKDTLHGLSTALGRELDPHGLVARCR